VRDERAWTMGTNFNLPHDISVVWSSQCRRTCPLQGHARRYRYVIYNDPIRPAHLKK
jgi:tRNA pseudouridine38-40 synthase